MSDCGIALGDTTYHSGIEAPEVEPKGPDLLRASPPPALKLEGEGGGERGRQ